MAKFLDLVGGADKFKKLVLSWFIPAAVAVFGFAIAVGPSLRDSWLWDQFVLATDRLGLNRSLGLVMVAATIAIAGHTVGDEIYRLLSGHNWPHSIKKWRINRAHVLQARYVKSLESYLLAVIYFERNRSSWTQQQSDAYRCKIARFNEKLMEADRQRRSRGRDPRRCRYTAFRRSRPLFTPRDHGKKTERILDLPLYPPEKYVSATNFGNRLAVADGYGHSTYGLDSQTFWYDLVQLSDDSLLDSIASASEKLDTLVASTFFSLVAAACCVPSAIWLLSTERSLWPAVTTAIAFSALSSFAYRALLGAVEDYGWAIRALVNANRSKLLEKHGLSMPQSAKDERRVWSILARRVQYGYISVEDEEYLVMLRKEE